MSTRWLGDLSSCFLLEDGWAFRQEVNRFLLGGRGGWRIPLAFAEFIGLKDGEDRVLVLGTGDTTVTLSRRRGHCSGNPIDRPLHRMKAADGDLLFLQVRGAQAHLLLRRVSEIGGSEALERLLWSCGLDPSDETLALDPWVKLVRALGGSAGQREEVRRRLMLRRDVNLLALQQSEIAAYSRRSVDSSWEYTGRPVQMGTPRLVLEGRDDQRHCLLGLLDASNRPPRGLTLTDGGLLWLDGVDDVSQAEELLVRPPLGLIPSARRAAWCRWLRLEHVLRLTALSSRHWEVRQAGAGWAPSDEVGAVTLIDALEHVAKLAFDADAERLPQARVRSPYPRSAGAFRSLVDEAIRGGLRALGADHDSGFRAVYSRSEIAAASIHECLAPRP